jgi:hypothetical protein
MPLDPDQSGAAAPSQWARSRALPRIIVHPNGYEPPPSMASDGYPDDWFVPSADGYPDDWFVPEQSATPGTGQPALAAQPNVTNPTVSNPPAVPRDPFAAYWSLIPASRVGAMAWDPPNLPLVGPSPSTNNFPAPTPPAVRPILFESRRPTLGVDGLPPSSTQPPPSPAIPQGGLFGGLARFGTPSRAWPEGGLLSGLIRPGAASPGAAEFPSLAQPRSDSAVVGPDQSRPLPDYSAGELSSDSWPVYVDQLQCLGRCLGFDAGTPRPMTPEEELVLNLLTFAATLPIPAVGGLRGISAARAVSAYEVGAYNALKARSVVGDALEAHHAVQASPAKQIIPGYLRRTGPSIALPKTEHDVVPRILGSYTGTTRDLLANDISNLRKFTKAHNTAIQDLIELNKAMYPKAFTK